MTVNIMGKRDLRGPSERANARLIWMSAGLGLVVSLIMAVAVSRQPKPAGAAAQSLLTSPLPAWAAAVLALMWGVVLPALSWRWHKVVDEHERDAYRDGAMAGYYAFALGAPVWWLLWRGGLAPALDAIVIYTAVMAVTGVVWMWRKYR